MVRGARRAGEEREGVWVAKRGMLMLLRPTEGVDPGELDEAAWRKIETAYISVVRITHLASSRQLGFWFCGIVRWERWCPSDRGAGLGVVGS